MTTAKDVVFRKERIISDQYMLFAKLLYKQQTIKHSQLLFRAISYWNVNLNEMTNNTTERKKWVDLI